MKILMTTVEFQREVKNTSETKVVCIPICEDKFLKSSHGYFTDYKI